jgi:hypothetical protein
VSEILAVKSPLYLMETCQVANCLMCFGSKLAYIVYMRRGIVFSLVCTF